MIGCLEAFIKVCLAGDTPQTVWLISPAIDQTVNCNSKCPKSEKENRYARPETKRAEIARRFQIRRPEAMEEKSPVEIVMDQAEKLKAEIAEDEEQLKAKKKQLQKFEEAKKIFETT